MINPSVTESRPGFIASTIGGRIIRAPITLDFLLYLADLQRYTVDCNNIVLFLGEIISTQAKK